MIDINALNEQASKLSSWATGARSGSYGPRPFPKVFANCLAGSFTGRILPAHPTKNPSIIAQVPTIKLALPGAKFGGKLYADPATGYDEKTTSHFLDQLVKLHYKHVKPLGTATEQMVEFIKGLRKRIVRYIPMILHVKDVVRDDKGYVKSLVPPDAKGVGAYPFGVILQVDSSRLWESISSEIAENQQQGLDATSMYFKIRRAGEGKDSITSFLFLGTENPMTADEKALIDGDKYPNILDVVKYTYRPVSEILEAVRSSQDLMDEFTRLGYDLSGTEPVFSPDGAFELPV